MKYLSERRRRYFARKSRWGLLPRRSTTGADKVRSLALAKAVSKRDFDAAVELLPAVPKRRVGEERLIITTPPSHLSLSENYEETLAFLMELRRSRAGPKGGLNRNVMRQWRSHIEMADIKQIGPAAGLVLAAELDSFRHRVGRMTSLDQTWHENVRSFFADSGLFELLDVKPQSVSSKPAVGPLTKVLKYRRGSTPDGQQADLLRSELEALCGEKFGPRIEVNNALCEAMTNAHHHAYPPDQVWWHAPPPGYWWSTGAWMPETGTMHMILYDQGVGIPKTLPRSSHWASALPILNRLDPERTDAGVIEAALELRRTSTHISGRGRGLYEMAEWIDQTQSGFLRILSGKGLVTYRPGRRVQRSNLRVPFQGTLIEWEINRGA